MSSATRTSRSSGGRGQRRRRFPRLRVMLWSLLAVVLVGLAATAYAYAVTDIPDVNEIAKAQTSIVYYADGRNEIGRMSEINRESVPLADVPVHVQRAMLAAEDRDFYSNPGVSPTGIARAVWATVRGGPTQGGSTITQQYVKNSFLSQEQTLTRKFKELIISLKVEQQLSKDQILESYLNTIYYGRGAYGIKTAARAYFAKNVTDLSVAEGALLASVIRGPSYYDPSLGAGPARNARERVGYVLDGMVQQGWLSPMVRDRSAFPAVVKPVTQKRGGQAGYLLEAVRSELVGRGLVTEDMLNRGGLRIVTTLDRGTQARAIEAVTRLRPSGGRASAIHVALAAVKPGDGAVLALYGGPDFARQQFNDATQGHFQGGSTFKVFTLVGALEKGISTKTVYDGSSPVRLAAFRGPGNPTGQVQNFGNHSYGPLTLKEATAKSSNTVFAKLNEEIGADTTMRVATDMGLPADLGNDVNESTPGLVANPANVFGTASARPIDMAEAYATLAANGAHTDSYLVRRITSLDGQYRFDAAPTPRQAVDQDVSADAVDALQEVLRSGTAQGSGFDRPAAGKTGTTSENRAVWFTGFTPQISTAVALHLPDAQGNPVPMRNIAGLSEITGATFPVRIWSAFMTAAHDGLDLPVADFPPRAGIGDDRTVVTPPPDPPTSTSPATTPSASVPTTAPTGPIPVPSLSTSWPWTSSTAPTASTTSSSPGTIGARANPETGPASPSPAGTTRARVPTGSP